MLKNSASIVLASFRPSTYPRGYASALHSLRPCWTAFLSILRRCFPLAPAVQIIEALLAEMVFPQTGEPSHDRLGWLPSTEPSTGGG